TRTCERASLDETLDAIQAHGLHSVQFNLSSAGLPNMPDQITPQQADQIRQAFAARTIEISALSGTFNMIHPNRAIRESGIQQLKVLIEACHALGTSVITLSTGTRNSDNMWHTHPDNTTPQAWQDLLASLREVMPLAEANGVTLAFEPEVSNVIDSAYKARLLIDQIGSVHLKVIMDGANLFHTGELSRMREILDEAFALLGPDIVLAHAKDLDHDGDAGNLAAGQGVLDYARYIGLLRQSGYTGPLILHGLTEEQVAGCVAFLRQWVD
ncbi:MAG: sugar phosphate isomerase/epimerase family protein, partial [Roseiflexaceae bacterium]|nr:sugar phosphate isomerase/epimerase family protein [Roseiflexaceae bacterium]